MGRLIELAARRQPRNAEPSRRSSPAWAGAAQAPARHPDTRLQEALHAQYCAGFDAGERTFYTRGWRAGCFHGAFAALVGAVIAVCTVKALGWL